MQESRLANLQRRFKDDALKGTSVCASEIKVTASYTVARRYALYQNTPLREIKKAVVEDFPILEEHMGAGAFSKLVDDYLNCYPSTHASLSETGENLPRYLSEKGEVLLSEIARYDWAQILSTVAHGCETAFEDIAKASEKDLESARLILEASVMLFESDFAVHEDFSMKKTYLLIRNGDGEMAIQSLSPELFRLLKMISAGQPMPQILVEVAGGALDSQTVANAFFEWVKTSVIVGFIRGEL